ncbi:Peptidase_C39 like family protein [Humidesulfovibrio mexicanus]|uniref:Peptidase_C39 like family protein n=1 Tax=Humidesulfovibrio mexicanus TaxID=147047 RepID=A0A239BJ23_9BACT|nr:C39 family peptidase [Humidesulfovibrio mexicanus]SNS07063.1 Peptidase_C39 like family protein [Humidesulfovibrio mexicanus]
MEHNRPTRAAGPPLWAALAFPAALAALLLAAVALSACARPPAGFAPPPGRGQVPGVPFHAQEDHQCGPASLAMVLNHLGDPATPQEISRAVYRADLRGSLSLDLVLYARGRGHSARFSKGAAEDIAKAVNAGIPPLVMVDEGLGGIRVPHFMVVTGYDAEGVIANSGRRQGVRLSWGAFLSVWEGAARWMLLVTPGQGAAKEGM